VYLKADKHTLSSSVSRSVLRFDNGCCNQFGSVLSCVVLGVPALSGERFSVLGETDVADGGLSFGVSLSRHR
jgi:hypothetical protein